MKELSVVEKKEIESKSMEFLKTHAIDVTKTIDVLELAKMEGIVTASASLPEEYDGFILIDSGRKQLLGINHNRVIGVNSKRGYEDKRFIIAHELGHYYLQYNANDSGSFAKRDKYLCAGRTSTHGRSSHENDVDFFAACLLMPAETFRKKHNALTALGLTEDEKVDALVSFFGAPSGSVRRRIGELSVDGAGT